MTTKQANVVGPLEQRFNNIMNSRIELPARPGQYIRCKVSGKPNYGYYDPRIDALKDLYSFNVKKATVLDSEWFNTQHAEAIALEQSGDTVTAEKLFNDLLNASQLSYGIINRDATKAQFMQDQLVDLQIDMVDVAEKVNESTGVITPAHKAVVVAGMTAVAAVVLSKGRKFGVQVEEPVAAPAPAPAETIKELVK